MPFKSKAQSKKFRVLESEGQLPSGTSSRWSLETPGGIKKLPEFLGAKKGKKKGRKGPTDIRKAAALRIASGK